MAKIYPFFGIRYNPQKIGDLSEVVTPPYDIISDEAQVAYHDQSPYNVIRLDKNLPAETDTAEDNPHTRAARYFQQWQNDGVLIEDTEPALYFTSVAFDLNGSTITRFGLIATVRLEPLDAGVILPHEETFSKVKSERLELMKACHANFSHIFSVYSDQDNALGILKSAIADKAPTEDFTDDAGHHHKVWRITDADIHRQVQAAFNQRRLFIADGHHRYETALNYRQWVKENTPDFDDNHPANFIMMYLCAVEDTGLLILPTHRLLPEVSENARKQLLEDAGQYFDIETIDRAATDPQQAKQQLNETMIAHRNDHIIGLAMKDWPAYYALVLKDGVMENLFGKTIAAPLRGLDVTVLTNLVLMQLMGFDKQSLDNEALIDYTSSEDEALASVEQKEHDVAFILNPPTNEQVRQIAEAGYTMPRKTTFYYPKVITGQVMNKLK
ncbi:MAG: DUF1015 domain-containing protein [Thermodesulfobacteriota bacterium]